jgi:energy-converting hydrogenase A subunit M
MGNRSIHPPICQNYLVLDNYEHGDMCLTILMDFVSNTACVDHAFMYIGPGDVRIVILSMRLSKC